MKSNITIYCADNTDNAEHVAIKLTQWLAFVTMTGLSNRVPHGRGVPRELKVFVVKLLIF